MKIKAFALLSGGLDSTLAAKVVKDQGIDVVGITFSMPFDSGKSKNTKSGAERAAEQIGIPIRKVPTDSSFLDIIKKPQHGYGKNINPCVDCKIFMLKKTKELLPKEEASFVITGEVLGQRPMSQHKQALKLIEKKSGLEGLMLRPLSAKYLDITIPEKEGWVDRDKLLDIRGRSRKAQIQLADDYGIRDYPTPAGGCLLTDREFSARMFDLMEHSKLEEEDVELLKLGRHFRISPDTKLIVGRNKDENEKLLSHIRLADAIFKPAEIKGPIGFGQGNFNRNLLVLASRIMVRYSDKSPGDNVKILAEDHLSGKTDSITVSAISEEGLESFRISS